MAKTKVFRKKSSKNWTRRRKMSINCKKPKGFSQKQYCKYGRKKNRKSHKKGGLRFGLPGFAISGEDSFNRTLYMNASDSEKHVQIRPSHNTYNTPYGICLQRKHDVVDANGKYVDVKNTEDYCEHLFPWSNKTKKQEFDRIPRSKTVKQVLANH